MIKNEVNGHPRVLSSTTLIGDDIRNPAGETLGSVKEIMLDLAHGRIMYAVMAVGGFLGLGERLFAVPWDALHVDTDQKCLLLAADAEWLKDAPGFDKDNWPDFADSQFHHGVYAHYGVDPYWLDNRLQDRSGDPVVHITAGQRLRGGVEAPR